MPGNPFDDDEPGAFGSTKRAYQPNGSSCGTGMLRTDAPISQGSYSVQSQLYDSQSRTQASQHRALASIAHSERIGIDTAEELVEQGEKLSRAENRLEDLEYLQKNSQKQINTLSSWFGGFRNMFGKKQSIPVAPPPSAPPQPSRTKSDYGLSNSAQSNTWASQTYAGNTSTEPSSDFDHNIGLMSSGMARLKGLAQGMNEELRVQNEQLERMTPRVDNVTDTMNRQNQQMNRLLGVKPK